MKLRYRDTTINNHTKARYHADGQAFNAQRQLSNFPTATEETADPVAADSVYEAFGDVLRERTRDTKKYRLVFEELMNYGFRRNLWGWKALGIVLSGTVLVTLSGLFIWSAHTRTGSAASLAGTTIVDAGSFGLLAFLGQPSVGQDRR